MAADGLVARPPSGVRETRVVLDARPGRERDEVVIRGHGCVPFDRLRTEEEVIRLLASGTDAFAGIYNPLHRNC